jgi:hypothetical protein
VTQDFVFSLETQSLSPLRRFKGNLAKLEPKEQQGDRGSYMQGQFSFTDVEVLEATEPYPFPTAEIRISYSTNAGSRWGALAKSIKSVLGPEAVNAKDLVGKHQEWAMLPYSMRVLNQETQQWEKGSVDCWQLVALDGAGPVENLNEYIAGVMDGKTESQLNQALMADAKIKARPDIITSLTERKLTDTLLMAGMVTRDAEGVFHQVL